MQPLPRRTKQALIAVVFFLVTLSVYHSSTPPERRYKWRRPTSGSDSFDVKLPSHDSATTTEQALPIPTRLCEGDECFRGRWRPRENPYTSLEEVKPWKGCPSPPPFAAVTWDQEKEDGKRLLDVMNWVWAPDAGTLKEWDAEAFIVRLLRSPGGLIIVGGE